MDGNQNLSQVGQNMTPNQAQMPQQAAPSQPAQSITQQPQVQMPTSPVPQKSSHIVRTLLIMIILAIIVVLLVLAYVFFANNQSKNTESIQIQNTTTTQVPKSSPTPATIEEEVNGLDVGNVDNDLKAVDADLQSL